MGWVAWISLYAIQYEKKTLTYYLVIISGDIYV